MRFFFVLFFKKKRRSSHPTLQASKEEKRCCLTIQQQARTMGRAACRCRSPLALRHLITPTLWAGQPAGLALEEALLSQTLWLVVSCFKKMFSDFTFLRSCGAVLYESNSLLLDWPIPSPNKPPYRHYTHVTCSFRC